MDKLSVSRAFGDVEYKRHRDPSIFSVSQTLTLTALIFASFTIVNDTQTQYTKYTDIYTHTTVQPNDRMTSSSRVPMSLSGPSNPRTSIFCPY